MKKIISLIKFMLWGTFLVFSAIFLVFTMVGFAYYYNHLKQDPLGYFSWWYGHIRSFDYMQYKYYFLGFEVLLLISGIVFIYREKKDKEG